MAKVKGFIDADGHVVESDAELLEFLPPPYKGREDLLSFSFFPALDGFHRQARRVADGKGRYIAKGSLKEWQQFLDEDEIAWSVLYPTAGLTFGMVRDKDWACAVAAGYNNYLHECFTKPEKRLKGMALIPLQSIPDAVSELRRAVKELGFVGAVLPAVGLRQPLGDQRYEPVYAAAQELGALLAVHAAPTEGIGLDAFEKLIEVRTLSHGFGQMIQMTSMIFSGVFDHFPELRIAYAEAGCGWVPYLMERLDMEYEHRSTQAPECKKLPSEHLRSGRIFIHCELEDRGIPEIASLLRDDILFCATDFPHEPRSEFRENIQKFLAREDVSKDIKYKIMTENPKRMYPLA
ncbi:MAG TPA: amidohydrolase family protein [Candidatus Binatia bacterium]|nr:amidohydrolase family protein [Candidatus Binatia bacterium]